MKLNFLCSDCRSWLQQNPSEIPVRCHGGYKWAINRYNTGDLDNALSGVGAVFDMAEIMLGSDNICNSFASDWLVSASEVLVRVLRELDRVEDSIYIHRKTSALLGQVDDDVEMKKIMPKLARIARDAYGSKNYLRVVH